MYVKQLPVHGAHCGCLNCGSKPDVLSMENVIAVGFGYAALTKDNETIFMESSNDEDFFTVARAEAMAQLEPYCDWRIILHGPLHGETYQRHGDKQWVLIEKNEGFA